jgi:hypothetical protein
MHYVTAPNSTMFVRVNAKAIKKEFVLRVAVHNYEFANTANALYISDVVNIKTFTQLQAYLLTLCKRYNYANYAIINNPYSALAKIAT